MPKTKTPAIPVTSAAPSTTGEPFRIACWPWGENGNPYQRLFYGALQPYGVEVITDAVVDDRWLKQAAGKLDAIHLHWPEDIWRTRGTGVLPQLRGIVGMWRFLRLARRLGLKRMWTIHNTEPHEDAGWIDRWGNRVLRAYSDLLIFHSQSALVDLGLPFPRRAVMMPHGNYAGVYPVPRHRVAVLREIGLRNNLPTVCCVGHLRGYKGIDLVVEAARRMKGCLQFIIAGQPHATFDIDRLRESVRPMCHVALLEGSIDNQQFADIVAASEAVLLPYRKITGSGVLLAAWTLGRGVIASDLPYFREMSDCAPAAAGLFRMGDGDALCRAIAAFLETPAERRCAAALRGARHYDWQRCIQPVVRVLRDWMPRGRARLAHSEGT